MHAAVAQAAPNKTHRYFVCPHALSLCTYQDKEFEVQIPEDRYILWEAEDQGLELPHACRMGCCTACAVKVTEVRRVQNN